jgi:hypothetical protein
MLLEVILLILLRILFKVRQVLNTVREFFRNGSSFSLLIYLMKKHCILNDGFGGFTEK